MHATERAADYHELINQWLDERELTGRPYGTRVSRSLCDYRY